VIGEYLAEARHRHDPFPLRGRDPVIGRANIEFNIRALAAGHRCSFWWRNEVVGGGLSRRRGGSVGVTGSIAAVVAAIECYLHGGERPQRGLGAVGSGIRVRGTGLRHGTSPEVGRDGDLSGSQQWAAPLPQNSVPHSVPRDL
jgi:hypothetical protein